MSKGLKVRTTSCSTDFSTQPAPNNSPSSPTPLLPHTGFPSLSVQVRILGVILDSFPVPAPPSESASLPGTALKTGFSSNHHYCSLLSHLNYSSDFLMSTLANTSNPPHGTWVCLLYEAHEVHWATTVCQAPFKALRIQLSTKQTLSPCAWTLYPSDEIDSKFHLGLPIASGKIQTS